MRITKQLLLLFVILLSFTLYSSVIGATIYVTPNGASDAPCDVYTPCDIYFAATYVSDSDTIIFLEGAYAISPSLVFDARNITLIGQSKENTTLEIQYGSSSGVKSKSSFHMKNFTIYTTGTGSAPQYALQIQESTPTDFIEGSFEDITFTGDFYYMTSLIYVMATNGSVALRNINIIEVDEMFQQYFYLSAQVIVADQIQVISSTGIYDIFLTYSDYLSISNFVMHNSTATSYIIRQNEWNNSNKSEVYLTNWEVSNSTFYSISLLGNITLDGLNINQTARGYYLFITSSMNTNSVITLNNSNILFDIGLDNGYYNYLYSSTANYSIIVDNSKVTKGYMSFNDLRTISLTNSYFLFCYFYIEAPEFYSRNSTYLEISTFRFDFNFPNFNPLTDEINGYIYVTNSSFINSPPDYYGTTIQITNTYSSPQMNTPVFWQDTIFYLVVSPYFSYYGDFPVTYENCYFSTISTIRGYEDAYYISNCPTETVTVNGTETYWAWGAVLVPYYYNCDLVCSQSVQFICDYFTFGGGNSLSLSWGYLMLILVSFVVLAIILIGVSVFVIMKRRRRRQAVRRLISNIVPPKPQA